MKKLSIILIFLITSLILTSCNNVPEDFQGTYRNGTAGSEWVVEQTSFSSKQALLYDFTYAGNTHEGLIIWNADSPNLHIDPMVSITSAVIGGMTGISKANKITSDNVSVGSALGSSPIKFYGNITISLEGYQFEYKNRSYLFVSNCEHIKVS